MSIIPTIEIELRRMSSRHRPKYYNNHPSSTIGSTCIPPLLSTPTQHKNTPQLECALQLWGASHLNYAFCAFFSAFLAAFSRLRCSRNFLRIFLLIFCAFL